MSSSRTLYKHQLYCLHGETGNLAEDTGASDTVFVVDPAVIADVTIVVGSEIRLSDGSNTSPTLIIQAIDEEKTTITTTAAVGHIFLAATPTVISRLPHVVHQWTESDGEVKTCPEHPDHSVQEGSCFISEIIEPSEVHIAQSASGLNHPELYSERLKVASGGTGVLDISFDYLVTGKNISGYIEAANEGDRFDFIAAPDTPAGMLTEAAAPGDTVLHVPSSVIDNVHVSMSCKLFEGATVEDLGRIIAEDDAAGTITVKTPTTSAFTTAAVVLISTYGAENCPLPTFQTDFAVGNDQLEGVDVAAGMILRIVYRNSGPSDSSAIMHFHYLT